MFNMVWFFFFCIYWYDLIILINLDLYYNYRKLEDNVVEGTRLWNNFAEQLYVHVGLIFALLYFDALNFAEQHYA